MVASTRTIHFRNRLAGVHASQRAQRRAACVDYAPVIGGLPLKPVTLPSHEMLVGWENAFVVGREITFTDLVQFVWLHTEGFGQFEHAGRRKIARTLDAALRPRFPVFNAVVVVLLPYASARARHAPRSWFWRGFSWLLRRLRRPTHAELFGEAVAEIRRLLREALADFPSGEDEGKPPPFAQIPQLVSLFVRAYPGALTFAEARAFVANAPLRELVQYVREALHRLTKGKDKLLTAEEAAVWADYLADDPAPPAAAN